MFKRILSIFISFVIISMCCRVFAASGYGDNNTGANNTITDTIKWLSSDEYTIAGQFITGVKADTSVSAFISKFHNSVGNVNVLGAANDDVLKTGMTVKHTISQEECKIIVSGDVNGDGLITVSDINYLSDHIIDLKKITDNVMFMAADVNSSNTVTIVDLINIRRMILDQ